MTSFVLRSMELHGAIFERLDFSVRCKDDVHNDFRCVYFSQYPTKAHACCWTTTLCSRVRIAPFHARRKAWRCAWSSLAIVSFHAPTSRQIHRNHHGMLIFIACRVGGFTTFLRAHAWNRHARTSLRGCMDACCPCFDSSIHSTSSMHVCTMVATCVLLPRLGTCTSSFDAAYTASSCGTSPRGGEGSTRGTHRARNGAPRGVGPV